MSLLKRIDEDVIKALKSGDKDSAITLRGLKSDIKYFRINNILDEVTDEDVIKVLSSAAKQRRDSIEKFREGKRDDLVANESRELELINSYLPRQLEESEIEILAKEVIEETEASGPADMGKIMKGMMPKVSGRADGKAVKNVVLRLLNQA